MRPIAIGEEAVLRPDEFSLEGRAIRKVRQSVSRLTNAGYRLRVVAAEDADDELRAALDAVSEAWRGNQPERGFTMSIDDLYVPGTVFAVAECEQGRVGGFLHLAPTPAGGGWSLSTMRRRPDVPNGLTEFLIVETLAWAKEAGATELSLNFCVFTEFISLERAVTVPRRVLRKALLAADSVFQLERLYSFNRKFFPEWRPRYLCVERLGDLPIVGLAYLRVEQLLVPPGPWTRSREKRCALLAGIEVVLRRAPAAKPRLLSDVGEGLQRGRWWLRHPRPRELGLRLTPAALASGPVGLRASERLRPSNAACEPQAADASAPSSPRRHPATAEARSASAVHS